MSFNGYLIQIGGYTDAIEKYIVHRSYHVSKKPLDLDSNRDGDGVLKRNVLDHVSYTISFNLRNNLNNTDIQHFMGAIRSSYINTRERKLSLTFYNPEGDNYITHDVYMVDPDFNIDHIDLKTNQIIYRETQIKFVGY
jgi:hypothetical protein